MAILAIAGLVVPTGAARAVDGVIEINQASALDAGGFPVTINTSGSYRLTSNLVVPSASTTAIVITAHRVTLDLNGFTILGPVICTGSGSGISCGPAGAGDGVSSTGIATTVRNGIITGVGTNGVELTARGSRVEGLIAVGNGGDGIHVRNGGDVERSIAAHNGSDGIDCFDICSVRESVTDGNGDDGIETGGGPVVGNVAHGNGDAGIVVSAGAEVLENAMKDNTGFGLLIGGASTYSSNAIESNGGTVSGGIETGTSLCNGNSNCP